MLCECAHAFSLLHNTTETSPGDCGGVITESAFICGFPLGDTERLGVGHEGGCGGVVKLTHSQSLEPLTSNTHKQARHAVFSPNDFHLAVLSCTCGANY